MAKVKKETWEQILFLNKVGAILASLGAIVSIGAKRREF